MEVERGEAGDGAWYRREWLWEEGRRLKRRQEGLHSKERKGWGGRATRWFLGLLVRRATGGLFGVRGVGGLHRVAARRFVQGGRDEDRHGVGEIVRRKALYDGGDGCVVSETSLGFLWRM